MTILLFLILNMMYFFFISNFSIFIISYSWDLLIFMNFFFGIYFICLLYYTNIFVLSDLDFVYMYWNFYFFKITLLLNNIILLFLFLNFFVFFMLIYFFFFYYTRKMLITGIYFYHLFSYLFLFNFFMVVSIILYNMLLMYLTMFFMQICFDKILLILGKNKKKNLNWFQLLLMFFGDILMIISCFILFYYFKTLSLNDLYTLIYSPYIIDMPMVTFRIKNYFMDESMVSMVYFLLSLGIFLKSMYFFYNSYYLPKVLNFSILIFLLYHIYSVLLSSCFFLYKCDLIFYYYSIFSLNSNVLLGMTYNNLLDNFWIYILLVFWIISILFLIMKYFKIYL